jgi:pimeloyl-ACP methyl ester carboxylesterase
MQPPEFGGPDEADLELPNNENLQQNQPVDSKENLISDSEKQHHFDEQFSKKETIQTSAGLTEVVDVKPIHDKDSVPVLLAPGWSETYQTNKQGLRTVHDQDRRGLTLSHPRTGANIKGEEPDYPMAEIRKMQATIGVLSTKGIDKADVIAHSEGAINTIIAASLYPERFRNLVLVNPAGLIGEDRLDKLSGRFMSFLAKESAQIVKSPHERGPLLNLAVQSAKYIAANPKRTIEEAAAITDTEILELIDNLHKDGIGISVVAGVDDPLFPINKITEVLSSNREAIDGFYSVKGGHNKIISDQRYMEAALNALDGLKNKG